MQGAGSDLLLFVNCIHNVGGERIGVPLPCADDQAKNTVENMVSVFAWLFLIPSRS